jgi:NADPH-dependent 2,4-dienoyl-CoA reductase/sulfur reductase-like enzyme
VNVTGGRRVAPVNSLAGTLVIRRVRGVALRANVGDQESSHEGAFAERGKNAMSKQTFVIVGASLGGAKAAEELRACGFEGGIALVGSESESPLRTPSAEQGLPAGRVRPRRCLRPRAGLRRGAPRRPAAGRDSDEHRPHASRVTLVDGRELTFDRLLLTTGAEPRRLRIPGAGPRIGQPSGDHPPALIALACRQLTERCCRR